MAVYSVKSPESVFVRYLEDMGLIKFEVLDKDCRLIGFVKIGVRSHLVGGKSTYRRDYGCP